MSAAAVSRQDRNALVLRTWELVNSERDLNSVLQAIGEVLLPVVPFDSVGVISPVGTEREDRLFAVHVPGYGTFDRPVVEAEIKRAHYDGPPRPRQEYDFAQTQRFMNEGTPYVCDDLLAKPAWFDHEFHLAASGIRAYTSIPLRVRGELIGAAVFTRLQPAAFTPAQLDVLTAVARAIAVAVSNALANEEIRKLREQIEAENIALKAQLGQAPWFEEIVGDSPALRRVLEGVEQVGPTDATVLITGETGTGKELIARALHRCSPRAHGPLVKVNCAAIPESLLASELFGHERGAFTGALQRRQGRFEQAHGGTLFLDEIGELPAAMQVLLLRVLQEREFERLGGSQTVRVDVRLVVATHRNLEEEVRAGRFRSDLYYRLKVFPLEVPPLRARPGDIAPLVAHFAQKYGDRFGKKIEGIDPRSLERLAAHRWPGNVRELENTIERAVILARHGVLTIDDAPAEPPPPPEAPAQAAIHAHLASEERQSIEAALADSRGKIAGPRGAARRLGLPASTLEFRIKKLGIDKFRFRVG